MEKKKFIFILNHSVDEPETAAGALQLAANMKAFDIEMDFFLINNGVLLAKQGLARSITWQKKNGFSPIHELVDILTKEFEVNFYICASCVKPYGLEGSQLIERASVKPGSFLGELLMERQSVSF